MHDRTPTGAPGLRARLAWSTPDGAILDGPRRYLLMRPDVLMGTLRRLPAPARALALAAFADSVAEHGADSLRAYFRDTGGDPPALLAATAAAAADLGWGAWTFEAGPCRLGLVVHSSPFAAGHGASESPVCAPIVGMLRAVAAVAAGVACDALEVHCAACGAPACRLEARWPAC
jgi:hypothetical protein